MKRFVCFGAIAGVIGTLTTSAILLLLGERSIGDAIALEEAAATDGQAHEALFSRPMQILGGALGLMLFGLFMGAIFGVVFAANRHRLGGGTDWQRARRLAAIGFVTLYLVPFVKYPPNPPAVGNPDSINERTIAYLSLVLLAIIAAVVGGQTLAWLRARGTSAHLCGPGAMVAWLVIVGLGIALLPANPDAIEVPVDLIWRFRLASAAGQLAFWVTTGVAFGWLTERATRPAQESAIKADATVS